MRTKAPPTNSQLLKDSPKRMKANTATVIGLANMVGETMVAGRCPRA